MLIKKPKAQWRDMKGSNDEARLINAFLTDRFIGDNVPDDECWSETRAILTGADPYQTIHRSFATAYNLVTKEMSVLKSVEPMVGEATRDVLRIMAHVDPLDTLVEELSWSG